MFAGSYTRNFLREPLFRLFQLPGPFLLVMITGTEKNLRVLLTNVKLKTKLTFSVTVIKCYLGFWSDRCPGRGDKLDFRPYQRTRHRRFNYMHRGNAFKYKIG